jgi:hypothetical protein
LCVGRPSAERVAAAMMAAVAAEIGGHAQAYVSDVANQGARVLQSCDS